MKRLLIILLAVLIVPVVVMAIEDVANTKHNLGTTNVDAPNDAGMLATNRDEVCLFCHTPHYANPARPLWNHVLSVATYSQYDSTVSDTMDMQVDSLDGGTECSNLCLSCHDGTVAVGVLVRTCCDGIDPDNNLAAGKMSALSGSAFLGTDLTNDHPVNVRYNTALDAAFQPIATVEGVLPAGGLTLYGANETVQCCTCHNPHEDTLDCFLKKDNAGSALCITCHIK